MKSLHRPDLFAWSTFDESRNIDFHSLLWTGVGGNVLIDPLPLSPHDLAHLEALGGAAWIILTNSDHTRAAADIAKWTGAKIAGPAAEKPIFPFECDRWLSEDDFLLPELHVFELDGSKTPGELALLIEGVTLVTGDLIRAHHAGRLMILPDAKLRDRAAAVRSVQRLADLPRVEAVLVGDGFQVYRDGRVLLRELAASL